MKPYGIKPGQFRDEDCGPPTKYADLRSSTRTKDRRKMHKRGRRGAREAIKSSIVAFYG